VDQLKALADPLRIRLLEAFCRERTTMQAAELLGEKPTRLYHHVEALERAGLVRLTRKRQKRGTQEKYYLAVARTFQADSRLFPSGDAGGAAEEGRSLQAVISTILAQTGEELRRLAGSGDAASVFEREALLGYLEIAAPARELLKFRDRLMRLLESAKKLAGRRPRAGEKSLRYRLTLACFPLEDAATAAKTGKPPARSR
jgi:DNA-binding transcriptional ArsR family regulator